MGEKLKNCPFCGGKAQLETNQDGNISQVRCSVCRASNLWSINAVELWNNRTRKITDLKPCPICGNRGIDVLVIEATNSTFGVLCLHCGLASKEFYSTNEAVDAWNRRPDDHD